MNKLNGEIHTKDAIYKTKCDEYEKLVFFIYLEK